VSIVQVIIPLVASLLYAVLFVLSLRVKRRLTRVFSVYLFTMFWWSFGSFLWHANVPFIGGLTWLHVGFGAGVVAWPIMFLLCTLILGLSSVPLARASLWVIFILGGFFLTADFSGLLFRTISIEGGQPSVQYSSLMYLIFPLTTLSSVVLAVLLIRAGIKTDDLNWRSRLFFMALSNILILAGGFANIPAQLRSFPGDVLFSAAGALLMAYAIYRYHLMDITLAVRRGLAYSILTVLIAASYLLVILVFERLARPVVGYGAYLIPILVAIAIAAALQPVRTRLEALVDRIFFREKYDAQQMVHELSQTVVSILDLGVLSKTLLEKATSTMHIAHACLFFEDQGTGEFRLAAQRGLAADVSAQGMRRDHPLTRWMASERRVLSVRDLAFLPQFKALWEEERKEMERRGDQLFVPLLVQDDLVGLLALGPKLSEQAYSEDEKLILATLANQAAVAVKNAQLYEDVHKELAERVKAEQALEESEMRYRHLFEGIEDAVLVYDAVGRCLDCNVATLRSFGYSREEFMRLSITDIVHPDFHQLQRDGQDRIWAGETAVAESVYRCKDGRSIPVEVNARRMEYMGEAAILAVVRDITERRLAEEQLRASLREKDVLLREIHHRVKNNLQIVSYLLLLQAGHVKDEQVVEMFEDSRERILSMALVHEKLYGSKDLSRINFGHYASELLTHIFRSYRAQGRGITLKMDVADVTLGIEAATPCGLILGELASNALKHAFPAGRVGEVRICLAENNGKIALTVADNGIGFPPDLDFRSTQSLGLQLVGMLVEQLDGTIDLVRNGGTSFHVEFTEFRYAKRI